jgi:hypothetical protein
VLLIERIRKNQIDGPLATLQLLSFILVVALVMDAVLLYRHFTDDALTPALDYLLSLKLAFPPVVVIGATYLYAFLTGESASEAPKSVENYGFVVADRSNLSTKLMKQSAAQNVGNVYLYAGDCKEANSIYSKLSLSQLNAGTEGNRVAALASCGKSVEAAAVGSDAIDRLQGKPEVLSGMRDFVSLLTNTGFVKLINKTYQEGLEDMQAAHDLIPDQMAKQNLALALIGCPSRGKR